MILLKIYPFLIFPSIPIACSKSYKIESMHLLIKHLYFYNQSKDQN
jgi:hypothetical protein